MEQQWYLMGMSERWLNNVHSNWKSFKPTGAWLMVIGYVDKMKN